jgi:hypothetical protein
MCDDDNDVGTHACTFFGPHTAMLTTELARKAGTLLPVLPCTDLLLQVAKRQVNEPSTESDGTERDNSNSARLPHGQAHSATIDQLRYLLSIVKNKN